MHISPDQHSVVCRKLFPRPSDAGMAAIYDGYLAAMETTRYADLVTKYEVTTLDRVVPALATWAHECGGFRIMFESGTYKTPERICEIFGVGRHSAAVTADEARKLTYNPVALFERVYGLGNPRKAAELGNHSKGDGFRFRGTGIQQTTGRADHERYTNEIGCPLDGLKEPINAIHAALLEWHRKGCNAAADRGDLREVRRLINGGQNGWEDFNGKCALIRKAFLALQPADLDTPAPDYLSLGDTGPAVLQLQTDLKARGFYESGNVDDKFGPLTQRAVVAFQLAHGLPLSGVYDPATQAALAAAPIEPTLPGRKAPDVPSRLDAINRLITRAKQFGKWVLGITGIGELFNSAGMIPVDKVLSGFEKAQGLITKLSIQPRFVLYAVIAAVGISFIIWAKSADDAQIEAKKVGAT